MRTHVARMTIPWALAAASLLAAGCGDDNQISDEDTNGDTAPARASADSAYCNVAVDWAIHELTPFDDTDPEAFKVYWAEYEEFEEEALATSPEVLEADWQLKIDTEDETIDVVLEKYDYDVAVMMEQATPEEQAAFEAPRDAAAAQDRIHAYESAVCGAGVPAPADVSYAGEERGSYCELVTVQGAQADEALASGDPAAIGAFVASQAESTPAIVDAAPASIVDDVTAVAEWALGPQSKVLETHGFDFGAAMRDGSAQDRFALNFADETIREQYARVIAYEEQVCGA